MDKTIEIMVVAMVALSTGVVILFLTSGQTDGFTSFVDNRQQDTKCTYWKQTCEGGEKPPDYCGESVSDCPPDTANSEGSGGTTGQSSNGDSGNSDSSTDDYSGGSQSNTGTGQIE